MKSLTLVLCVIAILGSAASTFFYIQIGKTKEQLQEQVATSTKNANELQAKLVEANTQGEATQKRLLTVDNERAEAISKATAAESRSTQLARDIATIRNQLTAKDDAEQALNREITQLKRELAQAKLAAASASPEEIEGYKATIATLQAKVTELESSRSTVGKLANTTAASASGATATSSTAAGGINAEVVSIGAMNAFVVLNAGSANGVQAGQNFTITRKGTTVATAQVSSVQENYAVAQIAASSLRGGLVKGDTATIAAQ